MANEQGLAQNENHARTLRRNCSLKKCFQWTSQRRSLLKENAREGESPVAALQHVHIRSIFIESRFLGVKRKVGGKLHLRLNSLWETDSEKVPRGKDEKDFGRRVKISRNC